MRMNIRRLLSSHKIITITVVVLGLFIILLPVAVKHTAAHLLKKNGAKNITIKDVDLNLFTGDIKIEGFLTMADEDENGFTMSSKMNNDEGGNSLTNNDIGTNSGFEESAPF